MAVWVSWEEEDHSPQKRADPDADLARVVRHVRAVMDRLFQSDSTDPQLPSE